MDNHLEEINPAVAQSRADGANLTDVLAAIPFKEEFGIRFYTLSGSAEHKGETISLRLDVGCGINISYKGKNYRAAPDEIIAGVMAAIEAANVEVSGCLPKDKQGNTC